ncbi:gamma-glutamyl-gamma-aminobutyrate hydrolase family protein [Leucobacter weissii]|uniref:Gamma-glutamyl-gamma-aminobutyrate hydrolase family protein n=1 Tax=Leucobacter weissii TaxID=1983706 RepID=A0A939SC76_9MICO|nr:gamma-glutamyl-gamma-aminobutyrate hydrolase family protein [Leucobacter weissii]MBO1902170.1 gamma-glutamyl-gamma-aminobutyrate hydrolase family protein [Leucobacter weissii]
MADLALDPERFARGPERADGPVIPVVVSLTFPGMDQGAHDLALELTVVAFDAVRVAGGRPRLVDSAGAETSAIAEICDAAAAVLFLGGGDVDVTCYGYDGPPPRGYYGVDKRADEFCIALMHECVRRDLPTLAFCRGSQLLNVAFGGTLIPDIEHWGIHRGPGGDGLMIDEAVTLEPGSRIAEVLGRTEAIVRNGHHQAVDRVGPELRAVAHAADGIVEGTEHRTASWVLGVQWHPEEKRADVDDRRLIFEALVERARARVR